MGKIADTEENFEICMDGNCSDCPSYPDGGKESLYCAKGQSGYEINKNGCNCPKCPLWIDNGLSEIYFCAWGKAS